jgi:hypothetical protein
MGPDNAEALGEALHPRHKLALTHLTLAGCPILVSSVLQNSDGLSSREGERSHLARHDTTTSTAVLSA